MNLTQFFDASIRLQEYGYKINFIDEEDKTYGVTFSYADVCSGLAFVEFSMKFSFIKVLINQLFFTGWWEET
jgi:hypothetical protein